MSLQLDLTWDNFRSTVLVRGEQRVHRVADAPLVEVFGDGVQGRVGICIEMSDASPIPPELGRFESITTRALEQAGRRLLEVATPIPSLHRQFFHFAVAVAERVIVEKLPATEAVELELQCFAELLEEKHLLSIERQIGLIGELLFLERVMRDQNTEHLDAWIGPAGEPHDFRLGALEFEVKTSLSPRRIHTINGTEQAVSSASCSLYLVSILLGPPSATDSLSLSERVATLSARFASTSSRLTQFEKALAACGFRPEDSPHYGRRYTLRRPIAIVPVNETFPAITRPVIQAALGPLAPRIQSLRYEVSVEGLEYEEGTPTFESALPARQPAEEM